MKIKNWKEHQHYKNRNPPWIRFHKKLLDDPDFFALSGDDFKVLAMCWLVASEDKSLEGLLPDSKKLAFRFRMDLKELEATISRLSEWILVNDSDVLAESSQDAVPNISTDNSETETDTPGGDPSDAFQALSFLKGNGVSENIAKEWLKVRKSKRLTNTETAFTRMFLEIGKTEKTVAEIIQLCVENSWGGFKASWLDDGKGDNGATGQKCDSSCFSFEGCKALGKYKPGKDVGCYSHPDNARR